MLLRFFLGFSSIIFNISFDLALSHSCWVIIRCNYVEV